ncbi:MAG: hypothetical protein R3C14_43030 [Caldilineaceae bacterium]
MAKKLQNLENKLGSWTDQATLTRTQPAAAIAATTPSPTPSPTSDRTAYTVARSLLDRIAAVGAQHNMSQNEVVGHLLTWALDQVESGAYQLPTQATHEAGGQ